MSLAPLMVRAENWLEKPWNQALEAAALITDLVAALRSRPEEGQTVKERIATYKIHPRDAEPPAAPEPAGVSELVEKLKQTIAFCKSTGREARVDWEHLLEIQSALAILASREQQVRDMHKEATRLTELVVNLSFPDTALVGTSAPSDWQPIDSHGRCDNVTAWTLAEVLNAAMSAPPGDPIDRGLATLRVFREHGFGIVPLPAPPEGRT